MQNCDSRADTLLKRLQVSLVLIDEVHLLNESRGASLEGGVVSRIKMIGALPSMREVTHSRSEGKLRGCHGTHVLGLIPDTH